MNDVSHAGYINFLLGTWHVSVQLYQAMMSSGRERADVLAPSLAAAATRQTTEPCLLDDLDFTIYRNNTQLRE